MNCTGGNFTKSHEENERGVCDFDDAQGVQLSFIYRKACRNAIIAHKNIIRSMQRSSVPPAVLLVSIHHF
jgi:hypothetical protein